MFRVSGKTSFAIILLCVSSSVQARSLTLAVWDFDNASVSGSDVEYLRHALSEMLLANLANTPGIRLVERIHLREALEEQKLAASELVGEEERLRLGRIAGANTMVFGSYMVIGDQVRIDLRAVDVETSLTRWTDDATGPVDHTARQMQRFAETIGSTLASAKAGAKTPTDLAIWKRYEQGIVLMDAHRYDQAIEVFKEILKTDPDFHAAEQQIKLALERLARQ